MPTTPCGVLRRRHPRRQARRRALQDHHRKGNADHRGPDRLPRLLQQTGGRRPGLPGRGDGIREHLAGWAKAIDPAATATTFPVVQAGRERLVFRYLDSASSRAGISLITSKLALPKVAIVGLGGTGSLILDLIAKTPIHTPRCRQALHPQRLPGARRRRSNNSTRRRPRSTVTSARSSRRAAWSPAGPT